MQAADELRAIVGWMSWQYESMLEGYSIGEIIQLHRYMKTGKAPDMLHHWKDKDFRGALNPCKED